MQSILGLPSPSPFRRPGDEASLKILIKCAHWVLIAGFVAEGVGVGGAGSYMLATVFLFCSFLYNCRNYSGDYPTKGSFQKVRNVKLKIC